MRLNGLATAVALLTAAVIAGEAHAGAKAAGGGKTDARTEKSAVPDATPVERPVADRGEPGAAAPVRDAGAAKKALTLVGRKRDGTEVRIEPSEETVRAVMEELKTGGGASAPAGDAKERMVFGKDTRTRVTNTSQWPYSAVGYLGYVGWDDNQNHACTGTMVDKNVLITNAECLYWYTGYDPKNPGKGGWNDGFTFWPGLNGNDDQPYGSFEYDTAYVFEGWITQYDGSWKSVYPYDLAVVTFQTPPGDYAGWMGRWDFDPKELDGATLHVLSYAWDKKPVNTQWESTCKFRASDVYNDNTFDTICDSGSIGEPIVVHDTKDDENYVVGVLIGNDGKRNVAIRLTGALFDWVTSLKGQ